MCPGRHDNRRSSWVLEVESRRGRNITTVALANKNARAARVVLAKAVPFDSNHLGSRLEAGLY